jgi:hypothetical protein
MFVITGDSLKPIVSAPGLICGSRFALVDREFASMYIGPGMDVEHVTAQMEAAGYGVLWAGDHLSKMYRVHVDEMLEELEEVRAWIADGMPVPHEIWLQTGELIGEDIIVNVVGDRNSPPVVEVAAFAWSPHVLFDDARFFDDRYCVDFVHNDETNCECTRVRLCIYLAGDVGNVTTHYFVQHNAVPWDGVESGKHPPPSPSGDLIPTQRYGPWWLRWMARD